MNDSHLQHAEALRKPKSMPIAIVLALVLGPFGLLYISAIGGVVILAVAAAIALFLLVSHSGVISPTSMALIVVGSNLISAVLALLLTKQHNQKIKEEIEDEAAPILVKQANLLYRFKKVVAVLLMLLMIGLVFGYYMYNKPHKNVATATPDKVMTTDALHAALSGKDSVTVAAFNKEILQVTGLISSINVPNDSTMNILLSVTGNSSDNINCAMDPEFIKTLHNLKVGDKLTVKGIFSGVSKFEDKDMGINTMDIILSRCVVIKE